MNTDRYSLATLVLRDDSPLTLGMVRYIVERLRKRAAQEDPGHGFDGDDGNWNRASAIADAIKAVAEELETAIGGQR